MPLRNLPRLVCVYLTFSPVFGIAQNLTTLAEESDYVNTGRYSEVESLCRSFADTYKNRLRCHQFGETPQGRPMLALIASEDGVTTPELIKKEQRPVVLAQGGIHAGEIDGKDAGFRLLRDILDKKILPQALSKLTFVFVPVFNVDGHERFGPNNRPNQNGPKEMGFRTTSQNFNLNRDYAKADAPEMRAMLKLLQDFDPLIYIDLHVTDGAQFQHEIAVLIEPLHTGDPQLRKIGQSMLASVMDALTIAGHKPLDFYPSFNKPDDPTSGFSRSASPPRFSTSYAAARNRFGVLVETHSWKDYKTRVLATYHTVYSLIEQAAKHASAWQKSVRQADIRSTQLDSMVIPLTYKTTSVKQEIDFLGYKYEFSRSEISNGPMLTYFPDHPVVWKIPLYPEVVPDLTTTPPKAGYLVPAELAQLVKQRLDAHGIRYTVLSKDIASFPVEQFLAVKAVWASRSFEGRMPLTLTGQFEPAKVSINKGALYVPIDQPLSRLVMALMEPLSPESFASWGDFNIFFERKEYMESYVAEVEAKKMLASNSDLRKEFDTLLKTDPEFANSQRARLDFFYKHHPSFDNKLNIYPIYRLNQYLLENSPDVSR